MTEQALPGVSPDLAAANGDPDDDETSALDVFRNRPFLLLWLSQAFTQIGGNMVIYGLTVIILETTRSNTAVSILILTFLGPAVLFCAVAGVYVDRLDKRVVLVVTNLLRFAAFIALYLVGDLLWADPGAQRRHLDDHRLLQPGRGRDDPAGRAAQAADRGERRVHAHAQRGVRPRLRAPRAARRGARRRTRR